MATDIKSVLEGLEGNEIVLSGDVAFLTLSVTYQHRLQDWLSLNASFAGWGRVGTSAQSALAQGVTTVFGVEFEARARAWRNDRAQLTVTARLRPAKVYRVTPFEFAVDILERGELTEDNELVRASDGLGLIGGLRGAYAVRDWLGLGGLVEVGSAESLREENGREARLSLGVSVSVDLAPRTDVPIGFLISGHRDSFSESADDIASSVRNFDVGVFYTGRDNFVVGLQATRSRLPDRELNETLRGYLGSITLSYYF